MLKFQAERHYIISHSSEGMSSACKSAEAKSSKAILPEKVRNKLQKTFGNLKLHCEKTGLGLSATAAQRGMALLQKPTASFKALGEVVDDISRRIEDELKGKLFLYIQPEKAKLYDPPKPLFGEAVAKSFPSASDDIAEAGKCLAADRGTAAVFHLMRVMEVGLKTLSKQLAIPYAPSWNSYLKKIAEQLEFKWKDKTPEWKKDEGFYSEAAAHLGAVKFAFRNPTMHIVKQ